MPDRRLDTSTAIVVAGALVGAGLFFGLRGRDGEPPAAALPAPSSPAVGAMAAAAPPLAQLVEQAGQGLEAQRAALVERCWAPAVKAQPAPPAIHYVFNFSFDAQGQQIMRGVVEERKTARPDVTQCVTRTLTPIAIPPPGAATRIDVPFTLP